MNVVPVVLGGADYSLIAPPSSYINVNDFDSADDLASYLQYLVDNPHEYLKYFWWKEHYQVRIGKPVYAFEFGVILILEGFGV